MQSSIDRLEQKQVPIADEILMMAPFARVAAAASCSGVNAGQVPFDHELRHGAFSSLRELHSRSICCGSLACETL